jgi:hypothetical protein
MEAFIAGRSPVCQGEKPARRCIGNLSWDPATNRIRGRIPDNHFQQIVGFLFQFCYGFLMIRVAAARKEDFMTLEDYCKWV